MTANTALRLVPKPLLDLWLGNPIFAAAGAIACRQLAERFAPTLHPPGAEIVTAGRAAREILVLLDGIARVFHRATGGRELVSRLVKAPMILGDAPALSGIDWLENVAAVDQVHVAWIPAGVYLELLESHPAAAMAHLRHMAASACVGSCNERQVFGQLEHRMANLLLSHADLGGHRLPDGKVILPPLSVREIARSLGTIRRSVTKTIASLSQRGLIRRADERFVLLLPDELEDLAAPVRHGLCYQMGMKVSHLQVEDFASEAEVEIETGPGSLPGRRFSVDSGLTVGRGESSQLRLPDELVSERHCCIYRGSTGWRHWVEDLGSDNGTLLDGRKLIRRAVLRGGELIQVGSVKLRFRLVPRRPGSQA
jgi:CRP-like cAMP-binding protein